MVFFAVTWDLKDCSYTFAALHPHYIAISGAPKGAGAALSRTVTSPSIGQAFSKGLKLLFSITFFIVG